MSWKVLWKKEILRNVRSWRWRCIWSGRLRSLIVEKWVHLNIYSTRADWKTVTVVVCLFSCQYRTTLVSWHQQRSLCSGQRRPVDCTVTLTHRLQSTYNGSVFQFTYISLSLSLLSLSLVWRLFITQAVALMTSPLPVCWHKIKWGQWDSESVHELMTSPVRRHRCTQLTWNPPQGLNHPKLSWSLYPYRFTFGGVIAERAVKWMK